MNLNFYFEQDAHVREQSRIQNKFTSLIEF